LPSPGLVSPGLVHYIYIWGLVPANGILLGAKFAFRPSLAFSYFGSVTARHTEQLASGKLCSVEQRAPPIFGRTAITLEIGPHSILSCNVNPNANTSPNTNPKPKPNPNRDPNAKCITENECSIHAPPLEWNVEIHLL